VKAGAVAVREAGPGDKRLVAYVVRAAGQAYTPEALRAYLKQKLPDYMVPGAFVFLEALPLNASGKVDRRKLAVCEPVIPPPASVAEPRNEIEERITRIWATVLGREAASIEQNFFDAGGHSLLATRVVSRVNSAFQVNVSLARFFAAPTIAALATAVTQQLSKLLDEIETLSDEEASVLAKGETPA
jgi:aspartate racemase